MAVVGDVGMSVVDVLSRSEPQMAIMAFFVSPCTCWLAGSRHCFDFLPMDTTILLIRWYEKQGNHGSFSTLHVLITLRDCHYSCGVLFRGIKKLSGLMTK